jgi:hypothetical protein
MLEKLLAAGAQSVGGCIDYKNKNLGRIVDGVFVPLPGAEDDIKALLDNIVDMEPVVEAPRRGRKPKAVGMTDHVVVAEDPAEAPSLADMVDE